MDALRALARVAAGRGLEPTAALRQPSVQTRSGGPRGDDGGQQVVGFGAGAGSPIVNRDGAPAHSWRSVDVPLCGSEAPGCVAHVGGVRAD